MNLLKETKEAIKESGHTEADIIFIGSALSGHQCSWDEFCELSDIEYDDSFGAQEVANDLIVVFRDSQKLCRREYDGSEWWEYVVLFTKPKNSLPISNLIANVGWESLSEINESPSSDGGAAQ